MTTVSWIDSAIFYHIYPLGLLGAPKHNDLVSPPADRLQRLTPWIDHVRHLGGSALYLGPVFESGSHGYDTVRYTEVDRRLGTNDDLRTLTAYAHERGVRVILDGVFHHVGRDFPSFQDLLERGEDSPFRDWFAGVDFSQASPYGDPFAYDSWNGHCSLVKLNLTNEEVRAHLFDAVRRWFAEFAVDGLRLDAADAIDHGFLRELAAVCRAANPDCWLLGEVIHGDYTLWANSETLDSVTNYEGFKGLYSSFNDHNLHEIAYSLNRQFGDGGIYRDLRLYSFADNHDVDRVASLLTDPAHLSPLYTLLFTMPGVPSIYYASEWGMEGKKLDGNDEPLRPALAWPVDRSAMPYPELEETIRELARIRENSPALRHGTYAQLAVAPEQFAFLRQTAETAAVVVVNAAHDVVPITIPVPGMAGAVLVDALDPAFRVPVTEETIEVTDIPPAGGRILIATYSA
jgi:cyclomaltodextrinase / maltogenic alpha-amylase / neopullulanase